MLYLCSLCPTFCSITTKMTQGSIILDPCVILVAMLQNVGHKLHKVAKYSYKI